MSLYVDSVRLVEAPTGRGLVEPKIEQGRSESELFFTLNVSVTRRTNDKHHRLRPGGSHNAPAYSQVHMAIGFIVIPLSLRSRRSWYGVIQCLMHHPQAQEVDNARTLPNGLPNLQVSNPARAERWP